MKMDKNWEFDNLVTPVICRNRIFSATNMQGEPIIDSRNGKKMENLKGGW